MVKEPMMECGLYISLDDGMPEMFKELHQSGAEKIVDICVRRGEVVKEFTLGEFLTKLGFDGGT